MSNSQTTTSSTLGPRQESGITMPESRKEQQSRHVLLVRDEKILTAEKVELETELSALEERNQQAEKQLSTVRRANCKAEVEIRQLKRIARENEQEIMRLTAENQTLKDRSDMLDLDKRRLKMRVERAGVVNADLVDRMIHLSGGERNEDESLGGREEILAMEIQRLNEALMQSERSQREFEIEMGLKDNAIAVLKGDLESARIWINMSRWTEFELEEDLWKVDEKFRMHRPIEQIEFGKRQSVQSKIQEQEDEMQGIVQASHLQKITVQDELYILNEDAEKEEDNTAVAAAPREYRKERIQSALTSSQIDEIINALDEGLEALRDRDDETTTSDLQFTVEDQAPATRVPVSQMPITQREESSPVSPSTVSRSRTNRTPTQINTVVTDGGSEKSGRSSTPISPNFLLTSRPEFAQATEGNLREAASLILLASNPPELQCPKAPRTISSGLENSDGCCTAITQYPATPTIWHAKLSDSLQQGVKVESEAGNPRNSNFSTPLTSRGNTFNPGTHMNTKEPEDQLTEIGTLVGGFTKPSTPQTSPTSILANSGSPNTNTSSSESSSGSLSKDAARLGRRKRSMSVGTDPSDYGTGSSIFWKPPPEMKYSKMQQDLETKHTKALTLSEVRAKVTGIETEITELDMNGAIKTQVMLGNGKHHQVLSHRSTQTSERWLESNTVQQPFNFPLVIEGGGDFKSARNQQEGTTLEVQAKSRTSEGSTEDKRGQVKGWGKWTWLYIIWMWTLIWLAIHSRREMKLWKDSNVIKRREMVSWRDDYWGCEFRAKLEYRVDKMLDIDRGAFG